MMHLGNGDMENDSATFVKHFYMCSWPASLCNALNYLVFECWEVSHV